MRPIKFRVWDKKTKEFVKGDMFFEQEDQGTFEPDCYHDEAGEVHSMKYSQKKLDRYHGYIIQQYTGLNDYKGKEIYEGDIIHYLFDGASYPKEAQDKYLTCVYDSDFGGFCFDDADSSYYWAEVRGYMEVIGNIFENPELLDKTKEL